MRWLTALLFSLCLLSCHTKKVATEEKMQINSLELLSLFDDDTLYIFNHPKLTPYAAPSAAWCDTTTADGPSVTTIVRHRHLSGSHQQEADKQATSTTTTTRLPSQSKQFLGYSLFMRFALRVIPYLALAVCVVIVGCRTLRNVR